MTFFFWKDPAYIRIRPYFHGWVRPYRGTLIGGILLGLVASAMTSGVPLVLKQLIDRIFQKKNVMTRQNLGCISSKQTPSYG